MMSKYNKLELIGFSMLFVGAIFWVSEQYFLIESLETIYRIAQIVFWFGLLLWALGNMRRVNAGKDHIEKE